MFSSSDTILNAIHSFFQRLTISLGCLTFEFHPTAILFFFIKLMSGWGQGLNVNILLHSSLVHTEKNGIQIPIKFFILWWNRGRGEGCMDCPDHYWHQRTKYVLFAVPCDSDHKNICKLGEQHFFYQPLRFSGRFKPKLISYWISCLSPALLTVSWWASKQCHRTIKSPSPTGV